MNKIWHALREIISFSLWSWVVIGVFDNRLSMVHLLRQYAHPVITDYLVLFVFTSIVLLLVVLKWHRFRKSVLFAICYPAVLLFRVLKRLMRGWESLVLLVPMILGFFKNLKSTVAWLLVSLSAIAILLSADNQPIQYGCLIIILSYLTRNYVQRIKGYYVSRTSVGSFASKISSGWEKMQEMDWMKDLDVSSEEYDKEKQNRRVQVYLVSSMFYFIARRAKEALRSGIVDVYLSLSLLWTIILTIVVFAIVNYGVYLIDASNFTLTEEATFITFLGYSFSEFMLRDTSFVAPHGVIAYIVSYAQLTTTLIVVFLVVGIILASARDRYTEDLENVIRESDSVINKVEATFGRLFNETVNEAELIVYKDLTGTSEKFAVFIMKLRHGKNFNYEVK
jgi:hypothetical protein